MAIRKWPSDMISPPAISAPRRPSHLSAIDPADDRRQVNQRGVVAVDVRSERLAGLAAGEVLLHPAEAPHAAEMRGQQQVVDHVQGQQRLHRVVAEALAALDDGEEAEALGLAEEGAVVAVGDDVEPFGLGFGYGHAGDPR